MIFLERFVSALVGIAVFVLILSITKNLPPDAYDQGVKDCLSGNITPVVHIEDGDTTIAYKMP